MLELLGLIGGAFFAYAAVPAAYNTIKAGKSIGVPIFLTWMIILGTIVLYSYLYLKYGFDWVLAINYSVELISWSILAFYYYKDKLADKMLSDKAWVKKELRKINDDSST